MQFLPDALTVLESKKRKPSGLGSLGSRKQVEIPSQCSFTLGFGAAFVVVPYMIPKLFCRFLTWIFFDDVLALALAIFF